MSVHRDYPDRYKRRTYRFVPWSKPTYRQVHKIIRWESARWGNSASHLASRIACESGFRWWASNGQYNGLGQFHSNTMARGLSTMPRGVKVKWSRIVRRHTFKVVRYSNNTVKRRKSYTIRVRRTRILKGRIRPSYLHGWAQVRIMAQAMVGRSAVNDSEWECR